jgi:hypothetical protein
MHKAKFEKEERKVQMQGTTRISAWQNYYK